MGEITFGEQPLYTVIDSARYKKHFKLLKLKNEHASMISARQRITFHNPTVEYLFETKLAEVEDRIKKLQKVKP